MKYIFIIFIVFIIMTNSTVGIAQEGNVQVNNTNTDKSTVKIVKKPVIINRSKLNLDINNLDLDIVTPSLKKVNKSLIRIRILLPQKDKNESKLVNREKIFNLKKEIELFFAKQGIGKENIIYEENSNLNDKVNNIVLIIEQLKRQ